ncbi:unnamed protein product, partial [Laminaria digitata]
MELLSILTDYPPLSRRLRAADAIPAVAECIKGPPANKGGSSGGGDSGAAAVGPRGPLVQLALIVLAKFVRNRSTKRGGAETVADIAATGAHVRVVSLLRAFDPKLRYVAAELVLELARHCPRAPAPANGPHGGGGSFIGASGVAKAMIQAGGLIAVWGVCSDPSPMARPVALRALATLLGTSAAMSRSTSSSEAVLALMYADVVRRLGREFVEPALASRAAGPR